MRYGRGGKPSDRKSRLNSAKTSTQQPTGELQISNEIVEFSQMLIGNTGGGKITAGFMMFLILSGSMIAPMAEAQEIKAKMDDQTDGSITNYGAARADRMSQVPYIPPIPISQTKDDESLLKPVRLEPKQTTIARPDINKKLEPLYTPQSITSPAQSATPQTINTTQPAIIQKYPELQSSEELKFAFEFAVIPAIFAITKFYQNSDESSRKPKATKSDLLIELLKLAIVSKRLDEKQEDYYDIDPIADNIDIINRATQITNTAPAARSYSENKELLGIIKKLFNKEPRSADEDNALRATIFSIISPTDLFVACIIWKDFSRAEFAKTRDAAAKKMIDQELQELQIWFRNGNQAQHSDEQLSNLAKVFTALEEKTFENPKDKEYLKKQLAAKFELDANGGSLADQFIAKKSDPEYRNQISNESKIESLLKGIKVDKFNPLKIYRQNAILFLELQIDNLIEVCKAIEEKQFVKQADKDSLIRDLAIKFGLSADKPLARQIEEKKTDRAFKDFVVKGGGIEKLLNGVDEVDEFNPFEAYNQNNENYLIAAKSELEEIFKTFQTPPTNLDKALILLFRYGYIFGGCVFAGTNGLARFGIKTGCSPNAILPLMSLCLICSYYSNTQFSLGFNNAVMQATDSAYQSLDWMKESWGKMKIKENWTGTNILAANLLATKFILFDLSRILIASSTALISASQPINTGLNLGDSINDLMKADIAGNYLKAGFATTGDIAGALTFPIMAMVINNDIKSLVKLAGSASLSKDPRSIVSKAWEHKLYILSFVAMQAMAASQTIGYGLSAYNIIEGKAGPDTANIFTIFAIIGRLSLASRSAYIAQERLIPLFESMWQSITDKWEYLTSSSAANAGYATHEDESDSGNENHNNLSSVFANINKITGKILPFIKWGALVGNGITNSGLVNNPLKLPESAGGNIVPDWLHDIIVVCTAYMSVTICCKFLKYLTRKECANIADYLNCLSRDDEQLKDLAKQVEQVIIKTNATPKKIPELIDKIFNKHIDDAAIDKMEAASSGKMSIGPMTEDRIPQIDRLAKFVPPNPANTSSQLRPSNKFSPQFIAQAAPGSSTLAATWK
jgi:hypothetical protein